MINKVAVITGASSGTGLAIANKLASQRYDLGMISRKKDDLVRLGNKISRKYKVRVKIYPCDVTLGEQLISVAAELKKDFKKIDALINNVGGSHTTNPDDLLDSAFNIDIDLNLGSTYLSCRLFSPLIKKGGAIVNISSLGGQTHFYPQLASSTAKFGYEAAKAGIIQLTKIYAVDLASRGIRVNSVAPGPIYPTRMTDNWDKKKQKLVRSQIPLKRIGKPEDVANGVYFLVSDLSSFITGHTLDINGGRYMR